MKYKGRSIKTILLGIFHLFLSFCQTMSESFLVHDKFSTNCYTNKRQSFINRDRFIFLQFKDGIRFLG